MRLTALAAVAALGVALAGCATGPTFTEMHAKEPPVAANSARIYFYRLGNMFGSGVQPAIRVNGVTVGDAVPGGYFYVDEPAGAYEISTSTEAKESINTTIKPGETRYVKFDIAPGLLVGHVVPTLVWPDQGASDIQQLHYIGHS